MGGGGGAIIPVDAIGGGGTYPGKVGMNGLGALVTSYTSSGSGTFSTNFGYFGHPGGGIKNSWASLGGSEVGTFIVKMYGKTGGLQMVP